MDWLRNAHMPLSGSKIKVYLNEVQEPLSRKRLGFERWKSQPDFKLQSKTGKYLGSGAHAREGVG